MNPHLFKLYPNFMIYVKVDNILSFSDWKSQLFTLSAHMSELFDILRFLSTFACQNSS